MKEPISNCSSKLPKTRVGITLGLALFGTVQFTPLDLPPSQSYQAPVVNLAPAPQVVNTPQGDLRYLSILQMEATAYYPGPEMTNRGPRQALTYSGKPARYGLVAVDPKVIPLGTKLYIPGYGKAEAADTGGAIKGMKIDLCFATYREAIHFGRKMLKVYILTSS